ncbi:hypothetical protein M9458_044339, partial [Cirrhinus mrigala]
QTRAVSSRAGNGLTLMDLNAHVCVCGGCRDGTAHLDRLYKTQAIEKRPRNQEEKIQTHSTFPSTG